MTQKVYIKTVEKSQIDAMAALGENFETCNVLATSRVQ